MKKFFISVALAAAVLNGVLASVGNGRISTSELQMADIENVAEGYEIWPPVVKVVYEVAQAVATVYSLYQLGQDVWPSSNNGMLIAGVMGYSYGSSQSGEFCDSSVNPQFWNCDFAPNFRPF